MIGRFLGNMSLEGGADCDHGTTAANTTTREFPGGLFEHASNLSVHDVDGEFCVSLGEPRFLNERDAAVASKSGAAAAWFEAFGREGSAAASSIHGRFAAILCRPARQEFIAVTDRFATIPICFSASDSGIRVGERADDVAGSNSRISTQAIFDYLFFHAIPAPETAFETVSRLPPSYALEWRGGKKTCEPYWRPVFTERSSRSLKENEADFLSYVESAVAIEAKHDNVGAFLSGGTDSSTIAGMLCKVSGKSASTYSIGFDASGYDEMEYARLASGHFGTDHHEYYVTPGDLLEGIPKIAQYYDQPFGNSSAVPAWICARRAREDGIEKLLAGDGGDELFGGNERYAKQRIFEQYASVPAFARRMLVEPLASLPVMDRFKLTQKAASYVSQARVPLPDRLQRYNLLIRAGVETVLDPGFLAAVDANCPMKMQRTWWESIQTASYVNHMIAFDWKYTLADNDLPKVIGSADLAGVDVGFPLMSDDLLEFSLQLPAQWKLKGQTLRWFFKHALRDFLPTEILQKQKHGFGLPFGVWACTDRGLKELARDSLSELGGRGIVKPQFIDSLLDEYLPEHPGYYGEMVWILIILEQWLRHKAPDWQLA